VANDIITRQLAVLESPEGYFDVPFDFEDPLDKLSRTNSITLDGIEREITLSVLENDQATEEMRVSLDVKTLKQPMPQARRHKTAPTLRHKTWKCPKNHTPCFGSAPSSFQ